MRLDELREITEKRAWRALALALLKDAKPCEDAAAQFSTYWVEGGHHIREQIEDDLVLVRLLRHILPTYEGVALTLYRGENLGRWLAGKVGFAWTADIEVARMFGRGLNSVCSGGVLLKGYFQQAAIIAGPNAHSAWLGEGQYTVDPLFFENAINVEEVFPPFF